MNNIALLIPHYNNPNGLVRSLSSISVTEQVDVFIVDDGSLKHKINESDIVDSFKANGRVFFKYLDVNLGIENALNSGIKFILSIHTYNYIARLDCGDLCLGNRFELQVDFMKKNPKIKLLGSNAIAVDSDYKFLYNSVFPENHKEIQDRMY